MERRDAVHLDGSAVFLRRIALVPAPAIPGIFLVVESHESISHNLGDDRCAGDKETLPVASDDRLRLNSVFEREKSVNEKETGFYVRSPHRPLH